MSFTTVPLAAMLAFAGSLAGCNTEECSLADEHVRTCLNSNASTPESSLERRCEEQAACSAKCVAEADCDVIKDFYDVNPTDTSKLLGECISKCAKTEE